MNDDKKHLMTELCVKQRKHNNKKYLLKNKDLQRFINNINDSIFNNDNKCVIWNGKTIKNKKVEYVNFYLNKKKFALHRILYINFIDDINDNQYIKFNCNNSGKCCNLKHMVIKQNINNVIKEENILSNVKITKYLSDDNKNKIIIIFNNM